MGATPAVAIHMPMTRVKPTSRSTRQAAGMTFSPSINKLRSPIQARFIAPTTNITAINAQQQPAVAAVLHAEHERAEPTVAPLGHEITQRRAALRQAGSLQWRELVNACGQQDGRTEQRAGAARAIVSSSGAYVNTSIADSAAGAAKAIHTAA